MTEGNNNIRRSGRLAGNSQHSPAEIQAGIDALEGFIKEFEGEKIKKQAFDTKVAKVLAKHATLLDRNLQSSGLSVRFVRESIDSLKRRLQKSAPSPRKRKEPSNPQTTGAASPVRQRAGSRPSNPEIHSPGGTKSPKKPQKRKNKRVAPQSPPRSSSAAVNTERLVEVHKRAQTRALATTQPDPAMPDYGVQLAKQARTSKRFRIITGVLANIHNAVIQEKIDDLVKDMEGDKRAAFVRFIKHNRFNRMKSLLLHCDSEDTAKFICSNLNAKDLGRNALVREIRASDRLPFRCEPTPADWAPKKPASTFVGAPSQSSN